MHRLLSPFGIVFLIAIVAGGEAACAAESRSIRDFGAVGNDAADDHAAFIRAAAWINRRGGDAVLRIPAGTYLVGAVTEGRSVADVLRLQGVRDVQIIGSGAVIRYRRGLRYGSFNPESGRPQGGKNFFDTTFARGLGSAIHLLGCSDVRISGLELDGNIDEAVVGAPWGDVGIQLRHFGIFIQDSYDVEASGCAAHHFGLDGFVLQNKWRNADATFSRWAVRLADVRAEFNGRQGLSWVGGCGLWAERSVFSNTGRGGVSSNPGFGINIEPETAATGFGYFKDCRMERNKGCGLGTTPSAGSHSFRFERCHFWGATLWAVLIRLPGVSFSDCSFVGSVCGGTGGQRPGEATEFLRCTFTDSAARGAPVYGKFLFEMDGVQGVRFKSCRFVAGEKLIGWLTCRAQSAEESLFSDCLFIVRGNRAAGGNLGRIECALFQHVLLREEYAVPPRTRSWINLVRVRSAGKNEIKGAFSRTFWSERGRSAVFTASEP